MRFWMLKNDGTAVPVERFVQTEEAAKPFLARYAPELLWQSGLTEKGDLLKNVRQCFLLVQELSADRVDFFITSVGFEWRPLMQDLVREHGYRTLEILYAYPFEQGNGWCRNAEGALYRHYPAEDFLQETYPAPPESSGFLNALIGRTLAEGKGFTELLHLPANSERIRGHYSKMQRKAACKKPNQQ